MKYIISCRGCGASIEDEEFSKTLTVWIEKHIEGFEHRKFTIEVYDE